MEIKKFTVMLYMLAESKGRTLTESQIRTFYKFMSPYGEKAVMGAMEQAIRSADDFFSVGKLIRFIEGDPEEIAREEWMQLLRLVRDDVPTTKWPDHIYNTMRACGSLDDVSDKYKVGAMEKNFIAHAVSEIVADNERRFREAVEAKNTGAIE